MNLALIVIYSGRLEEASTVFEEPHALLGQVFPTQ